MGFNKIAAGITMLCLLSLVLAAKSYGSSAFSLRRSGWGVTCWDAAMPSCKFISGWHDQGIHAEFMIKLFPANRSSEIWITLKGGRFMNKQPTVSIDGQDPIILERISLSRARLVGERVKQLIKATGDLFLVHPIKIESGRRIVALINRRGLDDLFIQARLWFNLRGRAVD